MEETTFEVVLLGEKGVFAILKNDKPYITFDESVEADEAHWAKGIISTMTKYVEESYKSIVQGSATEEVKGIL